MINTKKLFYELTSSKDRKANQPLYTLTEDHREVDGVKYISLYKKYMESVDEYDFAESILGGIPLLNSLLSSQWFSEGYRNHRGIESWREDMRMRDASRAKKTLMLAVSEGDVSAAKKLADMSKPLVTTARGRFKKAEVTKEAAKAVEDKDFLEEAAMRLNVVNIRD